jgi:hypothetical protein
MSDLVRRLSEGECPVEVSLRPEATVKAFKESLDRGYVHIKFTQTRGGTELGMPIDLERSDFGSADFDAETGTARIVGELTLDYVHVRCVAQIALPSLTGQGHLEVLEQTADAAAS